MNLNVSDHALQRAIEMELDGNEIREAALRPEYILWSDKHQCEWRTKGRVTAACRYNLAGDIIITTLLWATAEDWEADEVLGENRTRRHGKTPIDKLREGQQP